MNLQGKRVLLTGASGGIGYPLALALAARGALLVLVDLDGNRLEEIAREIAVKGGKAVAMAVNLQADTAPQTVTQAIKLLGGLDILINNAGILDFTRFQDQSPQRITQTMALNAIVPMQLAHAALAHFAPRNGGHIVNVGSAFGSIGFPHYAAYSASKFALRGFSEALRRELLDSDIKVTYIAPRATRTRLNSAATERMMAASGMAMDDPEAVAAMIVKAIEQEKREVFIGRPESIFARLNGVLPGLVDLGLKKQTRVARTYTEAVL